MFNSRYHHEVISKLHETLTKKKEKEKKKHHHHGSGGDSQAAPSDPQPPSDPTSFSRYGNFLNIYSQSLTTVLSREFDEDYLFARQVPAPVPTTRSTPLTDDLASSDVTLPLNGKPKHKHHKHHRGRHGIPAESNTIAAQGLPPTEDDSVKVPHHAHRLDATVPPKLSPRDFEDMADELLEREDLMETLLARYFEDLD